jgi:putative Holliday junction resolvase
MRIMGIDFGEARIGIALSDLTTTLATPTTVLHEKDKGRQINRVVELIAEHEVGTVVVGIPYQLDGTEGTMAKMAGKYAEKLGRVSGVEVVRFDERLTSMQAERLLKASGKKGKKRRIKDSIDMAAAAVILQAYLDSPRIP